ncbi:MAG: site-2 protease family protein, partial [Chloroflexi bacterium]|nr:site-2 protease family protein [Chloroflexota bacterium]
MLTIVYFILLLGILVFVHELGHFATAKAFGIQVNEFGFGFPPRLLGLRWRGTLYSLNLVPLGGFVKMVGEEDPGHPRSLAGKPIFTRFIVLVAGSFMNGLLAVAIFTVFFMTPQETLVGQVRIQQVTPDSPAARAGLKPGDTVLRVNGERVLNHAELARLIHLNLGSPMEWVITRGSSPEFATYETVQLVPRWKPPQGEGATGIFIATINPRVVRVSYPIWKAVPLGAKEVGEVLVLGKNEVIRWIIGGSKPQVAGPIGIAQMTGEVAEAGLTPFIQFVALLSINLAIINVFPIPMLDGGRLLFLGIEWVRRGKRVPPKREAMVHLMGLALLLSLVIVISYFD